MVLMNSNKSKGIIRLAIAGLTAAVISFTLTGVAENAMSGAMCSDDIICGIKRLTMYSATLAMPINEFDTNESTQTDDTVSQDKHETFAEETSSVDSIEEVPQSESVTSSNTPSVMESEPTESLVPAAAHVESKTGLISLNIRKDKDDLNGYTAKDGIIQEKHYGKITGDNAIDLKHGQVRNCTEMPSYVQQKRRYF